MTNSKTPEEYCGWDFSMNKRMANRWMLSGSFSWNADHLLQRDVRRTRCKRTTTPKATTFWFTSFRGSYQAKYGNRDQPGVAHPARTTDRSSPAPDRV